MSLLGLPQGAAPERNWLGDIAFAADKVTNVMVLNPLDSQVGGNEWLGSQYTNGQWLLVEFNAETELIGELNDAQIG